MIEAGEYLAPCKYATKSSITGMDIGRDGVRLINAMNCTSFFHERSYNARDAGAKAACSRTSRDFLNPLATR